MCILDRDVVFIRVWIDLWRDGVVVRFKGELLFGV